MDAPLDSVTFCITRKPQHVTHDWVKRLPANSIIAQAVHSLTTRGLRKWMVANISIRPKDNPPLDEYKRRIQLAAIEAMDGRSPFDGPLACNLVAVYPIRKQDIRKRGVPDWKLKHTLPDADNIFKPAIDACSKIVFHDDGQLATVGIEKVWSHDLGVMGIGLWFEQIDPTAVSDHADQLKLALAERELLSPTLPF